MRTEQISSEEAAEISSTLAAGTLVDFEVRGGEVVVPSAPRETFHAALTKGDNAVFDMQEYGPELAPRGGKPGNSVAAGWVYDKSSSSLTVGDGRQVTHATSAPPTEHCS